MPSQTVLVELETALAAAADGQRTVLLHAGQRLAVIGADDLERLEALDAAEPEDLLAIDEGLAELANGAPTEPVEALFKTLDL